MSKPIIAVTMGDPNSIGPELSLQALLNPTVLALCHPVLIGSLGPLALAKQVSHSQVHLNPIIHLSEAVFDAHTLNVYTVGEPLPMSAVQPGVITATAGGYAFDYVKTAIELALATQVQATVTNAISKEAMNLAGHAYPGHTEIYAQLTHTPKYSMMLAHGGLRVVHVSTHVSLREACERATYPRVLEVIHIAHQGCVAMGIANPVVGVCGLNPHAGENGMFGREEIDHIIPAIESAVAQGIQAVGPLPPDTAFPKARGGFYDVVVAMYHDQGHIPLKMEGFVYDPAQQRWQDVSGVNITLGLPIIRTSVDHGTAMDQAYQNTASPTSLINAIEMAVALAKGQPSKKGV